MCEGFLLLWHDFICVLLLVETSWYLDKMKQIRNSILLLLSVSISFVFTASVPMLHDDYGKYHTSLNHFRKTKKSADNLGGCRL